MWSQKYRPLELDNLVINSNIIDGLKKFSKKRNVPHFMFIGPAGCGKLTTALSFVHQIYGHTYKSYFEDIDTLDSAAYYELYKPKWFELAKYDKNRRGKSGKPNSNDILRTIVRSFPKFRSFGDIEFRILIINNAHLLSFSTQQALRRMMEKSTKTFRLILLCNNASNIIDPIQSRCIKISFPVLPDKNIIQVLRYIAEKENLKVNDEALKAILFHTKNDLTISINLLQCCNSFNSNIDGDLVYNIIEKLSPNKLVNQIFEGILNQDFMEMRQGIRNLFLKFGYMGKNILSLLYNSILHLPITEGLKIQISRKIGEIDMRIIEGANEEIQISYFLAYLYSLHEKFKEN
ncbi:MAG: hypothetical protein ACTSRG_16590 [Candidatus Helarchaeota archaeon]